MIWALELYLLLSAGLMFALIYFYRALGFHAAWIFAWYDLWVGVYWDRKRKVLYIFPVPMLGIEVRLADDEGKLVTP